MGGDNAAILQKKKDIVRTDTSRRNFLRLALLGTAMTATGINCKERGVTLESLYPLASKERLESLKTLADKHGLSPVEMKTLGAICENAREQVKADETTSYYLENRQLATLSEEKNVLFYLVVNKDKLNASETEMAAFVSSRIEKTRKQFAHLDDVEVLVIDVKTEGLVLLEWAKLPEISPELAGYEKSALRGKLKKIGVEVTA